MDIAAELTLRIARFIQMTADPPASPARWLFVPEFEHARWATAGELLANAPNINSRISKPSFTRVSPISA